MYSSVVGNPSHGTLSLNSDGSFTYTPTTGYSGADSFTYQDTDGFFTSNVATATITVGSSAPTAVDDSYAGAHDQTMTVSAANGVLANDTDPNGLTLTASVVTNPAHGSLSLNSDGSFAYTPNTDYLGSDSFTYQDSDGTATSNVATVSLTLTNTGVPAAEADSYSVLHDRTLTTTAANGVLANDSDIDGDTLSAVLISGPSHGTMTLNSDGSFSYTPNLHYMGSDSFSYQASDGVSNSSTVTDTISVTDNAPAANNDSYNLPNAQSFSTTAATGVLANDVDIDGDTLTASLVTNPGHGTLTLNSDGSFTYTPNAGWIGQDSFTYTASDGVLTSNTATVTLDTQYSILGIEDQTKVPVDVVQASRQILGDSQGAPATATNLSVSYSSVAGQPDAVIEAQVTMSNASPVMETVTASLTFNGTAQPSTYFTLSSLNGTSSVVHLADQVDTSSLPTGRYPFSMTITSPNMAAPATMNGFVNVVNNSSSPIGKGWDIPGLLRIFQNNVSRVPAGVLLTTGDGQGWYFIQGSGNTYTSPNGPYDFSTLTAVTGGGWQLADKYGTTFNFDSNGYLTSRVERTTETTTYNYSGALLTSISDQFGRSVSLAYTNGLLSSITDNAGNVTSFAQSGSLLTTITQPDPGGGAPVWTYGYTGNYLTSITDPTGAAYGFSYDAFHRESGESLPGGANTADSSEANYGEGSLNSSSPADILLQSSVTPTSTDALGNATGYQTDSLGNPTSITDPYGNVTTYQRDANGLVTTLTQPSPDGVQAAPVTTYSYDSLGNETSASGALSTFGTYTYNSFSEPTSFVDSLNHTIIMTYDAHGNLLSKQDALGNTTTWTYDTYGRPLTMTLPDPDGAGPLPAPIYHYAYDSDERLITLTNPDGTTEHVTYDSDDRRLTVEDENSHTTTTAYDALGRVTSVTNAAGGVVSDTYDKDGRVLTTTDEMGNVTTNVYNSRGELTSTTLPDPDGTGPLTSPVWSFTYDNNGDKLTQTDPLGRVTSWAYDNMGRVSTVTLPDPDGAGPLTSPVTTYAYDNLGRKISVTDATGGVTQYAYNSNNWLTSVTAPDPDGAGPLTSPVTSFGYDSIGEQTSVTDPMGHTSTTAFDADGRKTSVTDNLNHSTTFSHDNDGNLLVTTDALGHTVTNAFDSRGRITSTTDSLSGVTSYTYDGASNALTLDDPDGNTTTWTYDALNRVLTDSDQLGHTRSFSYDASGDLLSETDRNGRVRDFTYDNLHRRTSEQWMSGGTAIYTISYSYDAANQVTSASDPDSSYAYQYDDLGRVTSVDNNGTPGVPDVVLASQYDAINDRTQLAATIAGTADFVNTYQYDADQRLTQLVQQGQTGGNPVATKGANLSYNALGQLTSIFRTNFFGIGPQPDIATSTFSYDAGNRLTEIAYTYNGGTAIDAYSWTYDAANRVTSMSTTTDGTANYSYDNTNQVTGTSYTGNGQPANESYSYDSNGNRTNTGYTTGTNNQLTSDGTFNYAYDAEGNRTSRTRISNAPANDYLTTYTFDYRDRLTDVDFYNNSSVLTEHVHYTYDVFDHLTSKSVDSTGSGAYDSAEYYVYDGADVVLDFVDPDGAGPRAEALATRYLDGPGNTGATDQVFAQEDASTGNVLWLLADNLGTTRDVVDDSSTLQAHFVYNSFGQLSSGPTNVTPYLYTGQMWDADVGLQYNWHRWYDPAVARWISQDPAGFVARDANLTRYAANNTTVNTDPSGLAPPLGPPPAYPGNPPPPAVPLPTFDPSIPVMKKVIPDPNHPGYEMYVLGNGTVESEWEYIDNAVTSWGPSSLNTPLNYQQTKMKTWVVDVQAAGIQSPAEAGIVVQKYKYGLTEEELKKAALKAKEINDGNIKSSAAAKEMKKWRPK